MAKCCQTNNCAEILNSGCVKYTGVPTQDGLLDKADYCDPFLNDLVKFFDDNITKLDTRVGIDRNTLDNANTSCGTKPLMNLSTVTVEDEKYYSAEVVLKLVGVVCELRSRLNYLKTKDISTDSGDVFWMDLPLDQAFKVWLSDQCLGDDPCSGDSIQTLRQLFQAIIVKLCACCP